MSIGISEQELDAIEAMAEKATPGPWRWRIHIKPFEIDLISHQRARHVMGFCRLGMRHAQPMFRESGGWMSSAKELGAEGVQSNPDAAYIAALNPATKGRVVR